VRIAALAGRELGPTAWVSVGQDLIDAFAELTRDRQWIHVDLERAASGPFGATIAHGYLTLSLLPTMLGEVLPPLGGLTINYGLDRVRFPGPVPSGSEIRGRFRVSDVKETPTGAELRIAATIERRGAEKPVCVADAILRIVTQPDGSLQT
jgi:acyl dehydratase